MNRRALERMVGVGLGAWLWWMLLEALSVDWSANVQYTYGWSVPILALTLFIRRWLSRPPAQLEPPGRVFGLVAWILLLALFPIRLIEEANPEWRLILWVHAVQMVLLTLGVLRFLGGRAWGRHFAFPIVFVLVAVPWPMVLEVQVIQGLMRFVARTTVEAATLVRIPALQHGNVIEISSGIVGIDDACSGVRSLQSSFMLALFLGEFYRLKSSRRWALVIGGLLLALVANLARTFLLVVTAARHGFDVLHQWHDRIGLVVVLLLLVALWGFSLLLRLRKSEPTAPIGSPEPAPALPVSPVGGPLRMPSRSGLLGLALWILLVELGTEAWYRASETKLVDNPQWELAWPTNRIGYREVPIGEKTRAILRYAEGRGAAWQGPPPSQQWLLYCLRWAPGRNSAQLVKGHCPELCLPATGCQLERDLGTFTLEVHGVNLTFRQYVFRQETKWIHVFWCHWEERTARNQPLIREDWTQSSRLLAVRYGKRNLGQRVLEAAVTGPATPSEARQVLNHQLQQLIRVPE